MDALDWSWGRAISTFGCFNLRPRWTGLAVARSRVLQACDIDARLQALQSGVSEGPRPVAFFGARDLTATWRREERKTGGVRCGAPPG